VVGPTLKFSQKGIPRVWSVILFTESWCNNFSTETHFFVLCGDVIQNQASKSESIGFSLDTNPNVPKPGSCIASN
jgi:hypothetical protein